MIWEKHGRDRFWYFVGKSQMVGGAIFCEKKDLGITFTSWQVLRMSDGRLISTKDTCPENIEKTRMRHARNVYSQEWRKKHDIEEL